MNISILGGKVMLPQGIVDANIRLENGAITEISKMRLSSDRIIDAKGLYVLPGIIDPHVHMREPGQTNKENFFTGSCSAAAGGITTFLDMPNNSPPILTKALLGHKRELASKSIVNYGFHFGSSGDTLDELVPPGVASVKVFFDQSTGKLAITDEEVLEEIFRRSALITAHAEGNNVGRALALSRKTGTDLSLCHISSSDELRMITMHKPLGVEVTPHHLFLNKTDDTGPFTKMKPCLKTKRDQASLLQAIRDKQITHAGSDHAPHTIEEKQSEDPPYGIPGVETLLPLMLDAINRHLFSLKDLVRLCSESPAKIFRLKSKGIIAKGVGNLTIVDLKEERRVKADHMHSKCCWTPFEGKMLKGWPTHTIVNGNLIYDQGSINPIEAREVEYYERDS